MKSRPAQTKILFQSACGLNCLEHDGQTILR